MATAVQLRKIFKPILNQYSVPRVPQVTYDDVVIAKHPIGPPIIPQELLDVFYHFQLGASAHHTVDRWHRAAVNPCSQRLAMSIGEEWRRVWNLTVANPFRPYGVESQYPSNVYIWSNDLCRHIAEPRGL